VLLPRQPSKLARGAKDEEHAMSQNLSRAIAVIGIDIGKNSFHVVGLDERGAIALRQKWSLGQVEARLANMPPCLIGMEACVGAHHLSRKLGMLGHDARLMPAKYVRPYSKGQKNDFRDAEAIAEAVQRPTAPLKSRKPTSSSPRILTRWGRSFSSSEKQIGCQKRRRYSPHGVLGPTWDNSASSSGTSRWR
jgi:transposase